MLKTKEEISAWLFKMNITKFHIHDDLVVDVQQSVYMTQQKFKKFPIQFGVVEGDFYCANNGLISLKGSPIKVNGYFTCSHNDIKNLKYMPLYIKGDCSLYHNKINSLKGLPEILHGSLMLDNNLLTSLKYISNEIHGELTISYNPIEKLDVLPNIVKGEITLNNSHKLIEDLVSLYVDNNSSEYGEHINDYLLSASLKTVRIFLLQEKLENKLIENQPISRKLKV